MIFNRFVLKYRESKGLGLFALLGLALFYLVPGTVQAQGGGVATWRGEWQGYDLTVRVIARGHAIPEATQEDSPWWEWGNTRGDAYLFSFRNPETIDLILDFSNDGDRPRAELYTLDEDQSDLVTISEDRYTMPEGISPSLVIWPRQGDWLLDGKANFNLDGYRVESENRGAQWQIQVGGDAAGRPVWWTAAKIRERREKRSCRYFRARELADPEVSYEMAMPLMPTWPYLSVEPPTGHWDPKTRPIYFNTSTRRVRTEWVGFHTSGLYEINSPSCPPIVDFESPYAFYRFDPSHGQRPNLVIRAVARPADREKGFMIPGVDHIAFRMSWTDEKPNNWRYSINTAGDHPYDEQVIIGETVMRSISYPRLPEWVVSRSWQAVSFVEATRGVGGSEGIYDLGLNSQDVANYIYGFQERRPLILVDPDSALNASADLRLKDGFRAEFSLGYSRVPSLYFSPIDNRVHLEHAEEGIWNLGDGLVLKTDIVGEGSFVNVWTRERLPELDGSPQPVAGEAEERLYALVGHLLHTGPEGLILRKVDYQPASFFLRPPTDRESWRSFLRQVEPYQDRKRSPYDLGSWLEVFPGDSLSIAGGALSGVRATDDGFQFMLELPGNFNIRENGLLPTGSLAAGRYLVVYDGQLRIGALTPPSLQITKPDTGFLLEPAVELQPNQVRFLLSNSGQEDVQELKVFASAQIEGGKWMTISDRELNLFAGDSRKVKLDWTPPRPGEWTLRVETFWSDNTQGGRSSAWIEETVEVIEAGSTTIDQTVGAFGGVPVGALFGLLVAPFVLACLILVYVFVFDEDARLPG